MDAEGVCEMNEKRQMLRRIYSYDFTILELGLYLDTHSDDMRALKTRQQVQETGTAGAGIRGKIRSLRADQRRCQRESLVVGG